jgi:hypothetical protein
MGVSLIIVDDFYNNVDDVREFALQQDFNIDGNYPGHRTISFINESIKTAISNIVSPYAGNITWWGDNYTGAYQYTTQHDRSWIHADQTTMWAGVCYLTPNAPYSSGTGLFRHKTSGLRAAVKNPDGSYDQDILSAVYKDSRDMTKWELMDVVGNVYNRLVIYRGDLFHMSLDYFGSDRHDGRLFQTFFFNTER